MTCLMTLLATLTIAGCTDQPEHSIDDSTNSDAQRFDSDALTVAIGRSTPLFPNSIDPDSSPSVQFAEEAIQRKLNITEFSELGYLDLVNAELALKEPPDLIHMDSSIAISKYVKEGLIMPLDGLLRQHGPALLRLIPQEAWDAVTFQGQIYAIPSLTEVPADEILYARKDWLDRLMLDPPRTLEQYYEMMRAFTYDDPDGNNKNDTWGLTIVPDGLSRTGPFFGAFGVPRSSNPIRQWMVQDDEIMYSSLLPEAYSAIKFLAKLYGDGILDRDFVLNNENTYINKVINGQVGIYSAYWEEAQQVLQQSMERNPDARWIRLQYPVGKDGLQGTSEIPLVEAYNVIPTGSRQPGDAIKLLNFIAGEGHRTLKLSGEDWGMLYALADPVDPDVRHEKLMSSADDPIVANNVEYVLEHVLRSDFTGLLTDSMHRYADKLKVLEEESFIKIIMGIEPVKDFEDFTLQWIREGGWEISNEVNAWFRDSRRGIGD